MCADATSAAATFSITTFGPVTISVLCPGREPIDQQLAVPHSNTVREISCAKPAAGWKAGDRIQLRISAGAGQPPCNPVFAAAQLTVLPTPRLRVTPEGTPAPVCYGSKTATARFRVLSDEVTGAGTFTYDVDSGCTTEVTGKHSAPFGRKHHESTSYCTQQAADGAIVLQQQPAQCLPCSSVG